MDDQQSTNSEQTPITDELAALLDDLVLALRDARTNVCEALQELRHEAAARLYELADRLLAPEER